MDLGAGNGFLSALGEDPQFVVYQDRDSDIVTVLSRRLARAGTLLRFHCLQFFCPTGSETLFSSLVWVFLLLGCASGIQSLCLMLELGALIEIPINAQLPNCYRILGPSVALAAGPAAATAATTPASPPATPASPSGVRFGALSPSAAATAPSATTASGGSDRPLGYQPMRLGATVHQVQTALSSCCVLDRERFITGDIKGAKIVLVFSFFIGSVVFLYGLSFVLIVCFV